ncbi:MAG: hypothetical protein GX625_18590 [Clostridiaceae bacterium]|jgi:hypothetical protein|nr:hypothetical protein [Clostridiaceae bacterium]
MNSKEMGIGAANYIAMGSRIMEIAVQRGTEAGIKAAMDYLAEEKKQLKKGRYDRRLRNTRLLLKNYRSFRNYAKNAVYKASQLKENAVDILDGLDEYSFDDSLYIESIKKSQQRTLIILNHIDEMLRYYKIDCEQSGKDEELRRYRIIVAYYINEQRKSAEQIAEDEHIERRTLYKDINMALKPLSALIFGIDSMKLY